MGRRGVFGGLLEDWLGGFGEFRWDAEESFRGGYYRWGLEDRAPGL